MTRLPNLERQLLDAARTLDAPRRRWWRIALFGSGITLAATATAVGAVRLLLPEGDAVPPAPPAQRVSLPRMEPGTSQLLSVRAPDPEGGLPWGIAIARSANGQQFCVQVGRVQGQQIGVIGRDGAYNDDGRFHPLSADSNQSQGCTNIGPGGALRISTDQPPIPASGYTGSVFSPVGGCRENVPDDTIPPATLRELRDIPVCEASSLRLLKYGLAGRDAVRIEYAGESVRPDPAESGAYLFVVKPPKSPQALTVTYKDGTVCRSTDPSQPQGHPLRFSMSCP